MTPAEQIAELDAATASIDLVRAAIADSKTDDALALIEAAQRNLQTALEATTTAQAQLDDAKAALQGTTPLPPGDFYTATTSRDVKPKPAPLVLGPAGFQFTDPVFGTSLTRVTDEHTGGGSIRVPSNSHIAAWNADSSSFYVINEGGGALFYHLNGGLPIRREASCGSYIEPAFSYVDPHRVWCAGGPHYRVVYTYDLATGATSTVCDLDQTYPQLGLSGYIGGTLTTDGDVWVTFFGGASQDQHRYIHHSTAGLLDVVDRCGVRIHAISIDRPGRYVLIYATSEDINAGKPQVTIWDTVTAALTGLTHLPGGHDSVGYGCWVNQDCCTETSWDGCQWQFRQLAAPTWTKDLIVPPLEPQEIYISDHSNWRHNTGQNREPVFSFLYRRTPPGTAPVPWRAWDDEVICIAPDGSGVVHRFCHHQSLSEDDFWSQPIGNVSPDGRWAIFTSNWGKTLAGGRQDVFLLHLT